MSTTEKSKELRDKARVLKNKARSKYEQMKALLDGAGSRITNEQAILFDHLDDEQGRLLSELQDVESQIENEEQPKDITKLPAREKFKAEKFAMQLYLKNGYVPMELNALMPKVKLAVQGSGNTAGGYTIPEGFANLLEKALKSFGGVWEYSKILKSDKGNPMPYPTVDDTNNKGYRIDESGNLSSGAQAVVFGKKDFNTYKYTSGLILVPNELLEDSDLFAVWFIDILAERIFRITNEEMTTGDGSDKPNGLLTAAEYGCSSADDQTLAYDDFVNLKHTVDAAYRKNVSCAWMFHDTVLKAIEKIKDTTGRPVFGNLDQGIILDHPYVINNDLPAFTPGSSSANDGKKMVLFGDMSKYVIRTAKDMRVIRLGNRYADSDQTALAVNLRADGELVDAGTHPVKYLRMSAS